MGDSYIDLCFGLLADIFQNCIILGIFVQIDVFGRSFPCVKLQKKTAAYLICIGFAKENVFLFVHKSASAITQHTDHTVAAATGNCNKIVVIE